MIKTPLCEMLGIKYPIFQGGMAHISDARLASAVSNAGGVGLISAASGDTAWLENEIDKAFSLTDKPFGVNIMLMAPNVEEAAQLCARKKVAVVTTGAGTPTKYVPMWKDAGIKVIPVVPSTAIAKLCERAGADAVIAEGGESGGHVGDLTTMALVPQVCDAVNIPVIAAGGIADGRGIAAALMLGAVGVQIGTAFLVADECCVPDVYKEKVLEANDTATIVTGRRLGHPVRSLKSPFSRSYAKAEYSDISNEDLENMAVGSLRAAVKDGDEKKGCFLAGQISGMIKEKKSAESIIEEMLTSAENILNGAKQWVK